ncbi:RDD family protein [Pseudalkalibacillus caeni]|uniref:RDD family protein n=1 Tax=Exobacillus caeni TaxID=2574798 RepID=A0A5R9EVK2_9BACL|nr:RDD family protein [Pseudalkalibacillus caeni]TLS35077.1 RDD family protein [Pseudalkalibacillus caeni]
MEIKQPAGFWIRLGASLLDGIITAIPFGFISYLITGEFFGDENSEPWPTTVLGLVYSILLPVVWHGYVIGKKIVGIRILKANGEEVGLGTMLLRVLVGQMLIYALTLGIGAIVSAFMVGIRKDKRSIHDFIAGTYVTYDKP